MEINQLINVLKDVQFFLTYLQTIQPNNVSIYVLMKPMRLQSQEFARSPPIALQTILLIHSQSYVF
jgi:hypothetical protein